MSSSTNYLKNKLQSPDKRYQKKKSYDGAVHTPRSQKGLGDYYGTGIVQKMGRMRGDSTGMVTLSKKQMKKPPRSLA